MIPVEARIQNEEPVGDADEEPGERGLFRKRGRKRIRQIPHVPQIDEMDCGAASLAMVWLMR